MKKIIALLAFSVCATALANAQLTLQLVPSDYNGANISCFGLRDGSIDLIVSGGTAPYIFTWSNGASTEDINSLTAGYYHVQVQDANFELAGAEITLTEPGAIGMRLTPYYYTNGYNISQYGACNGSVDVLLIGGVTPFTFLWTPGMQTIAEPPNLCAGDHSLEVTDANGCTARVGQPISQPERSDWQMAGNSGTNPSSQFIGTTDNKDLVFKTNNSEALRLKANGDLKINSFAGNGNKIILADNSGNLLSFKIGLPNPVNPVCNSGLYTYEPFVWQRDNQGDMTNIFDCWHRFGIGTALPQERLEVKGTIRATNYQASAEYISIGHDGGNARIDNFGVGSLLINYNNPKDVAICTGTSGNVHLGGNNYLAEGGGSVGIGTNTPATGFKLDVAGKTKVTGLQITNVHSSGSQDNVMTVNQNGDVSSVDLGVSGLALWKKSAGTNNIYYDQGIVTIGTDNISGLPAGFNFGVCGGIKCEEVKIKSDSWCDFVFENKYKIMPLQELDEYIKLNKHLPEIPGANEIVANGVDLGDMVKKQMQKIEELTLYAIEQNKKITEQDKKIDNLEQQMNLLKK